MFVHVRCLGRMRWAWFLSVTISPPLLVLSGLAHSWFRYTKEGAKIDAPILRSIKTSLCLLFFWGEEDL